MTSKALPDATNIDNRAQQAEFTRGTGQHPSELRPFPRRFGGHRPSTTQEEAAMSDIDCERPYRWIEADFDLSTVVQWRRRRIGVKRWGGAAVLAICLALPSPFAAAQADDKVFLDYPMDAEDKLAQQPDNPLAKLITVPIQSNFDFGGARALNVLPNAEYDPRDGGCVGRQCS